MATLRLGHVGSGLVQTSMLWMLLAGSLIHTIDARTRRTAGRSGALCEDGTRQCLSSKAQCVNDVCVCTEGKHGNGDFACYEPGDTWLEVKNDPFVYTATREVYELPVSCRFLLTHFRTAYRPMHDSWCELKIHGFNRKHRGKFYLHGIDIALRITTPLSLIHPGEISWRVSGTASNGKYTFTEHAARSFAPDGPWPRSHLTYLYVPGAEVFPRFDSYNNMFHLTVDGCGFEVRFRPNDVMLGKSQTHVPGVSVSVRKHPGTEWLSQSHVMGVQPGGLTLSQMTQDLNLGPSQLMALRMFESNVTQNQPDGAEVCSVIPETIAGCPGAAARTSAVARCFFMLRWPRFVRCYDNSDNGQGVLSLFNACLAAMCGGEASDCSVVRQKLQGCAAGNIPDASNILANFC